MGGKTAQGVIDAKKSRMLSALEIRQVEVDGQVKYQVSLDAQAIAEYLNVDITNMKNIPAQQYTINSLNELKEVLLKAMTIDQAWNNYDELQQQKP